jgi:hypothetical protein
MSHPEEGLIHAWLDGELDAEESARVEALVASDPAWAAAVAEARGLIAATSRIVGALDRVPANVIPKTAAAPRRAGRQWMMRAAAVVVLLGGSAVVLNRTALDSVGIVHVDVPVETPSPAPTSAPAPVQSMPRLVKPAKPAPQVAANGAVEESKSNTAKKELSVAKQDNAMRDKDAAAPPTELRGDAAARSAVAGYGRGAERVASAEASARAAAAPAPAPAPAARGFALQQKVTRLPLSCFEQRAPADSVRRIIRLDAAALDDSIQLEKLTLRGDTLAAVHGPLIAVRIPCQAP